MKEVHVFTKGEEIANAIIHGIGALLSVAALAILITFSSLEGNVWHIVSFTIFGVTMLLLYVCSTFCHALPPGKAKNVFEIMDHSSIYYFIAGTYTPFLFIVVEGPIAWVLFGISWSLAIGGTVFKAFFVKKFLHVSTILYIVMGWMIVFVWEDIYTKVDINGVILLGVGGLLYTLGCIFYVWRGFKYHHAIWHLFVLGGSVTHFLCILLYVLPIK